MWVPNSIDEIERAARSGELEETPAFDAKADLPVPRKNSSLAVDVAAMATDGGALLYGVGEDAQNRPTVPVPIALTGAADRVAQIVSTSIAEVPHIEPHEYPCPDDPSKGYLLVLVPQSARAPHQVTVGGDLRFYGRGPKGNRILTEGEVARLYERRQAWAVDRERVLAEVIANAPVPPRQGLGYVHAYARPVVLDQGMFERSSAAIGGRPQMHQHLLTVVNSTSLRGKYGPSLERATAWDRRGADEWRLSNVTERDDLTDPDWITSTVMLGMNIDGRGSLFCGRATDTHPQHPDGVPFIIEVVIAGNVEAFLAVMGSLYEAAGYHGSVDIGVAVTGIKGAGSGHRSQRWASGGFAYSAPVFSRTERVAASELNSPADITHNLLRNFYEATTGIDGYNPFTDPENRR